MATIYRVTTGTPFGTEVRDFPTLEAANAELLSQAAGGRLMPRLEVVEVDDAVVQAELLAHRIAAEAARREAAGEKPLGRDSTYNAVREAAIAVLTEGTN